MGDSAPGAVARQVAVRQPLLAWLLLYAAFVVYGSLVPLDFRPRALSDAWAYFQNIPMFSIGAAGRADWIANGVLYVPLALLATLVLGAGRHRAGLLFASVGAVAGCAMLAVAVEFAQLFFPPRTVSMNDLVAEWIGSVVGTVVGCLLGHRLRELLAGLSRLFAGHGRRWLVVYAIAYAAFSLFPYDVILGSNELGQKLQSDTWGWLLAGAALQKGTLIAALKCFLEGLTMVPVGILWMQLRARRPGSVLPGAFAAGTAIGLLIESLQFFLLSGVSQGVSGVTRGFGMAAGAMLAHKGASPADILMRTRRYAPPLGLLYLLLLAATNGWWQARWNSLEVAAEKLSATHFLPFYYHYYTSEATAVVSLAAALLAYAPVAYFTWVTRASARAAACIAGITAFAIEAGKLFIAGTHPDPSNIWIGAFSAWAAMRLLDRWAASATSSRHPVDQADTSAVGVTQPFRQQSPSREEPRARRHRRASHPSDRQSRSDAGTMRSSEQTTPPRAGPVAILALLATLPAVAWCALHYPVQPAILTTFLAASGLVVWRWPALVVGAIPAALPLLDLAPWTGRFYLDEFDLFLAIVLAVAYARVPALRRRDGQDWLFKSVAILVAISYALSSARGVLPWQEWDANAFSTYYSPYNALRLGKGALWGFLCLGLLRRLAARGCNVMSVFSWGMVVGLAGTVAVICWERMTFPGLLNFSNDYRVTGPFSQLHTGGADMEVFLTVATPFLVFAAARARHWATRAFAALLFVATTYAVMVTFSRAAYAAYAVALGLSLVAAMRESIANRARPFRQVLILATIGIVGLAVALPIVQGKFSKARLAQSQTDWAVRTNHWLEALHIRDQDFVTALLGMGLGRYPETAFWRGAAGKRSAVYRLEEEPANQFLRLGAGNPIYVEQVVNVRPGNLYHVTLDVRSPDTGKGVTVSICEKWLFASFGCVAQTFSPAPEIGKWVRQEVSLSSDNVGSGRWYARRTTKLGLYSMQAAPIDVDNVRIVTTEGEQLLSNGDFSRGLDHWFFSADDHMPWHIFNLPVNILFDQGWLGIVALGSLYALAIGRATRAAVRRDALAAGALLAALVGWTILGLFNSLLDSPRIVMLSLLIAWLALAREIAKTDRQTG